MFHRKMYLLLVASIILGACTSTPVEPAEPELLNFNSDPRILRGLWSGANDNHELFVEAEASEPSENGYTVTGSFTLDGENSIAFSGYIYQPVTQASDTLSLQVSPIETPFYAVSTDSAWTLAGGVPEGQPPEFNVTLYNMNESYSFTMGQAVP